MTHTITITDPGARHYPIEELVDKDKLIYSKCCKCGWRAPTKYYLHDDSQGDITRAEYRDHEKKSAEPVTVSLEWSTEAPKVDG